MKELIDYLNQSGLTDLVRIYMVVGGILFIAVLAISIWIIVRSRKGCSMTEMTQYQIFIVDIKNGKKNLISKIVKKES